MDKLPPCKMCGAPWAQAVQELEAEVKELQKRIVLLEVDLDITTQERDHLLTTDDPKMVKKLEQVRYLVMEHKYDHGRFPVDAFMKVLEDTND